MKKKVLILAILFQLAILGFTLVTRQITLMTGEEITLRPQPFDPRDPFYGDYLNMRFTINTAPAERDVRYDPGQRVYVTLQRKGDDWAVKNISVDKPTEKPFLKAKVMYSYDSETHLEYGFERYFIEESTGRAWERDFAQNAEKYRLIIAVDENGSAVVKELKKN